MNEIIGKLNNRLSASRPEFYASLQPPLHDNAIALLEEKYKVEILNDLRALYQWKNGQAADCFDAFVNNSMFIPLEEALGTAAENTSMIGLDFEIDNWWNENWIPVFHNGGGDYICYDRGGIFTGQSGQLIEFWHADNDRNVIAPSLETFLSQIACFYETKSSNEFDEYFEVESMEGFPKKFILE